MFAALKRVRPMVETQLLEEAERTKRNPALCSRSVRNASELIVVMSGTAMTRVRMDKWLWAARFFKTRALAARACELGRIESNGQQAKASREVRAGDLLQVKNDSGDFQVEVLVLSEMRGPAAVAQTLYRETEASRELRLKLAEERKAMPHFEASREGKPSKRDRREIDRFRGRV
jgi:ribosome-associated heat shock protein Hsp15